MGRACCRGPPVAGGEGGWKVLGTSPQCPPSKTVLYLYIAHSFVHQWLCWGLYHQSPVANRMCTFDENSIRHNVEQLLDWMYTWFQYFAFFRVLFENSMRVLIKTLTDKVFKWDWILQLFIHQSVSFIPKPKSLYSLDVNGIYNFHANSTSGF